MELIKTKNMKKVDSTAELLVGVLLGIPLSIAATFYQIFIIIKLVEWFQLPVHLSYMQWFGAGIVLHIIGPDSPKSNDKSVIDMFSTLFGKVIGLTILLGLCFIVKSIWA